MLYVFLVCPFVFPGYLFATVGESAVVKIILNEEDKGVHFILVTGDKNPIIPEKTLMDFGFTGDISGGIAIGGVEYVSLKALYPDITYELDEAEGVLIIKSRPGMFVKQVLDFSLKPRVNVVETVRNSAFMNYNLNYVYTENNGAQTSRLSVPSELGIKLGDYFAYSNFFYDSGSSSGDERFDRIRTNITRDDEEAMRRYVIGDVTAYSGSGGSSMELGGISVSKNFSIQPYFLRIPSLELAGTLYTPSEVNVYVNGALVRRERLPPGAFELLNIPPTSGPGDVMLEIKDAYGSIRRMRDLYYLSSNQLKPGLHEYSYSLGAKKQNLFGKDSEYKDFAVLGFHRVGISNDFTLGFRGEADEELVNLGVNVMLITGIVGELSLFADGSTKKEKQGTRISSRYTYYPTKIANVTFQATSYDIDYETLIDANASTGIGQQTRYDFSSSASTGLGSAASISAFYSYRKKFDQSETKTVRASYNMRVVRNLNLLLTAYKSMEEGGVTTDTYFALFSYYMGDNRSLNVSTQFNEDQTSTTLDFQKNPNADMGSGYGFGATDIQSANGRTASWNGDVERRAANAVYELRYRGSDGGLNSYNPSISGSVALIDGGVYFSRPIRDSFALVKTRGVKGLPIERSNQLAGITNSSGAALVPGLISYYDNKISVDMTNLPLEYVLEGGEMQYVKPGYRGASVVEFRLTKLQVLEGRLFFIEKGVKISAKYAMLEITIEGELTEAIVGANGEFYLENIPPGTYTARLFDGEKECEFGLTVPESDRMVVDVGEISCEAR